MQANDFQKTHSDLVPWYFYADIISVFPLHETFPIFQTMSELSYFTKADEVAVVDVLVVVSAAELRDAELVRGVPAAAPANFLLTSIGWRNCLEVAVHVGACRKLAQVIFVVVDDDL